MMSGPPDKEQLVAVLGSSSPYTKTPTPCPLASSVETDKLVMLIGDVLGPAMAVMSG
jgi:hypothetical protein